MHDLLHLMFQDGTLTSSEVKALRRTCKNLRENPVRVLRSLNIASPMAIQDLFRRYYGIAAVTEELIDALDENFKALVPPDIALNYSTFAISDENDRLYVALEDPTDKGTLHDLQFFLGKKIVPVAATALQLARGLNKLYGLELNDLRLSTLLESSRGVVGGSTQGSGEQRNSDSILGDSGFGSSAGDALIAPESFEIDDDDLEFDASKYKSNKPQKSFDYYEDSSESSQSENDLLANELLGNDSISESDSEQEKLDLENLSADSPKDDFDDALSHFEMSDSESPEETLIESPEETAAESAAEISDFEWDAAALSNIINGLLVKLSMVSSLSESVGLANSKLNALNISIEAYDSGFQVTCNSVVFEINETTYNLGQNVPFVEGLRPLFKKFSRMKIDI